MHAAFVACLSLVPVVRGFQGLTGDLPGSLTANSTCSLADFYTKCGNDIGAEVWPQHRCATRRDDLRFPQAYNAVDRTAYHLPTYAVSHQ